MRLTAALLVLLVTATAKAQGDDERVWLDAKGGFAAVSPGGSSYQGSALFNLTVAASRSITSNVAIQLAADFYSGVNEQSGNCGVNPAAGSCNTGTCNPLLPGSGCIAGTCSQLLPGSGCVTGNSTTGFKAAGAAVSLVLTSSRGDRAPTWGASFGAGYYSVGASSTSSVGYRVALDRAFVASDHGAITVNGGVLVLPMGSGSAITVVTLSLGLRVF